MRYSPAVLQRFTRTTNDGGRSATTPDGAPLATRCQIDARGAHDQVSGAKAKEASRWLIILPVSAAPTEHSEVTQHGVTYVLLGEPWLVRDTASRPDHYECTATKK